MKGNLLCPYATELIGINNMDFKLDFEKRRKMSHWYIK